MGSSTVAAKKAKIRARHAVLKSWSLLALEYPGVKRGTLQRFATTDYVPSRPDLRRALGLPALGQAEVCPIHGVVHVAKRCPVERKTPARPRRQWKKIALMLMAVMMVKK